jgi:alpha-tubulin suppressor-like RCC1 family protein
MTFKTRDLFQVSLLAFFSALGVLESGAAVPQVLNHQGRIAVAGVNFNGSGQFKFALVNGSGSISYWSNDGTSTAGAAPTSPVMLTVTNGLYAVLLGDSALANMTALPASALDHDDVRLRVWFNDGSRGFQQISPDQRLAAVPYAFRAENAVAAEQAVEAARFTGLLSGDVSGAQNATSISNQVVTGKFLTGFASSTGTLTEGDSILSALGKIHGNAALLAPLESPIFTGTVSGIDASMVGLGSVTNTSDANKPVSTAQQTALELKANLASPTFTGTVGGITAAMVGLGNVSNTSDANKPVSTAQQAALELKANLASPAFTGTVLLPAGSSSSAPLRLATGTSLTTPVFGSVEFDGTGLFLTNNSVSPTRKALAFTDGPTFTGVPLAPTAASGTSSGQIASTQFVQSAIQNVIGAAPAALDTLNELAGALNNDASYAATITNALSLKAPLASPTFTGTTTGTFSGPLTGNVTGNVSGSATSFSGSLAGDVTGTQGATTISAATVTGKGLTGYVSGAGTLSSADSILTAINKLNGNNALKADLASPTFTGTVGGITSAMVGLGNVSNTSDANKPVSTAQQTALELKANLASPAFTGTVLLPAGSSSSAPLRLATGTSLTTPVFGSVEFDGTNLYLTTNSASPTRKAVVLSDSVSITQVPLASVVAAPLKPVVAWGENTYGQVTVPSLSNVANVACGASHSLALLDNGTVLAWGLNSKGQTTVPSTATGVTEITAGAEHNLVRKSDGTLIAWGNNFYGQCTIPANINTAAKVAAGANHSLALLGDGSLRAWGDNYWGQTTIPSSLGGVTVTAIAAGYDHSLALTSAGAVVAWGRGGEVDGVGQTIVPAEAASGVVAIAAGAYHSLALKSNGTVVAWGWDISGQVTAPASWSGITRIAAGYGFSLGLKSDGTLIFAGDTTSGKATFPAEATQITAIAAGANHAVALRSDSVSAQVARLDQDNVFTGKVGIQRSPATNALEVNGNASKSTAGNWLSNSDRRIKTDIESISGALEKLDQVRLVDFRYHQDYLAAHPEIEDRRYPNVIAQEFARIFPDDVKSSGETLPDGSEMLQVDTYPLTIYTAAAVQELHRENQALKQQISAQELRLRKLEAALGE